MKLIIKAFYYFERIVKTLENISLLTASIALTLMALVISTDTILRYVLHKPISGVLEVTESFLMVAVVFLGLSYTQRKGEHIRIQLLTKYLPKSIQKINYTVFNSITIILYIIIGTEAWKRTIKAYQLNQFSTGAVEIPIYPAYFIVAAGSFILCSRILIDNISVISSQKNSGVI